MSENGTAVVTRAAAEQTPALSAFGNGDAGFDTAQRIAKALASSTIVPTAYQGNISNCLVAMEYAHRIGASVLAVMQNMDVIHGKPGLRSTFLIGTVNASGRFTPIRFRWQGEEGTNEWGCRAVAKDRETGEECLGTLITIQMAKDEEWYSRKGSKWKTMPEQMLMYRAATFWTRIYCPELSLGLHSSDELEDMPVAPEIRSRTISQALDAGDDIPLGEATVVSSSAPSKPVPAAAAAPSNGTTERRTSSRKQQSAPADDGVPPQLAAMRKTLYAALEERGKSPNDDEVQQWMAEITRTTGVIDQMSVTELKAVIQKLSPPKQQPTPAAEPTQAADAPAPAASTTSLWD